MPIHLDDAILDELTSDPASPVNGQIWYNSTDDVVRARINGVTRTLGRSDITVNFASDSGSWIETKATSPTVVSRLIFKGSTTTGVPSAIKALVEMDSGVTGQVTIYDLTNSNQIAQASSSSTTPTILDLGTLSNIPSGPAVIEIQLTRTAGVANVKLAAIAIEF